MSRGTILVVDDKASLVQLLVRVLGAQHHVIGAHSAEEAKAKLEVVDVDVVLTDIRMPGEDGLALLRAVKARRPGAEVILMTAHASIASAVDAMRAGAFDYLPKPFEPDDALVKVQRALEVKRLRERAQRLETELADVTHGRFRFDRLLGRGPALQRAVQLLEKAAGVNLTVLLVGETGTGKELAARALHAHSPRASQPFVAVNCGAFPAELLESELFGHVKGAFTGAVADRRGLVEEAEGGTLFLDEIGDLAAPLQVKLNRLLQERTYRRVGESKERSADVRVVSASHKDLGRAVVDGAFREDLYYRLKVFVVELPPLRARPEDIEVLARHFVAEAQARLQLPPRALSPGALRALQGYAWPGNVRELRHALERAVAVSDGAVVDVVDLPAEVTAGGGPRVVVGDIARLPYKEAIALLSHQATRDYLTALLASEGGNVSKAAERAGLARESLHRLLKKHGIDRQA